jgi:hypothetical protein
VSVTYRVTGTAASVIVEYDTQFESGVEQEVEPLPWTKVVDMPHDAEVVLTALNLEERGSVRCEIEIDGQVLASDEQVDTDIDAVCVATVP